MRKLREGGECGKKISKELAKVVIERVSKQQLTIVGTNFQFEHVTWARMHTSLFILLVHCRPHSS
jgi:hypothetical protein